VSFSLPSPDAKGEKATSRPPWSPIFFNRLMLPPPLYFFLRDLIHRLAGVAPLLPGPVRPNEGFAALVLDDPHFSEAKPEVFASPCGSSPHSFLPCVPKPHLPPLKPLCLSVVPATEPLQTLFPGFFYFAPNTPWRIVTEISPKCEDMASRLFFRNTVFCRN